MVTKKLFVAILESMRTQIKIDEKNSSLVAEAFGATDFYLYDNSLLFKAILSLLRVDFPKDKTGFCELDHFCFSLDFGKLSSEEDFETSEQLYDRLVAEKSIKIE